MKVALAIFALAASAAAQHDGSANAHYQTEEQRKQIASWLGSSERDRQQKPAELVGSLRIQPGSTVADIGTGPGYLIPHLSAAVGPKGRVLAEDVFPDMLARAGERIKTAGLSNVTTILGTADDPRLPTNAVDLAIMLDVYHHIDHPERVLARLRIALKDAGRLVLVDYYRKPGAMPGGDAVQHIRADEPQIIREVESNGFQLVEKREHIPHSQYVLEFRKR